MENDLKGIENYFESMGGSSYRESTVPFNYFYDRKHVSNMVALKLPEREFKGLLNLVRERMLKHVYGINLLCTALKKSALVQFSKNTITPRTSKLKSISKYQFLKILYVTLKQVKDNSQRCAIHDSRIRS